ncbi:hypothetical protein ABZ672_51915, partial [Streptomyces mirabilis]
MDRTPQRHAESLLNALDPLPFPQRMRELALRVKERAPLRPVLEELESRGPYERGIAVVAAAVGRDADAELHGRRRAEIGAGRHRRE